MVQQPASATVAILTALAAMSLVAAEPATSGTDEVVTDPQTPYFALESSVSVGNKGEESLDVSVASRCGDPALLFDHAELVVKRNRFGDVQFVGLPQPGCVDCAPITLRWFHEPTGYLSFEVKVYRRLEVVPCASHESHSDHG